MDSKKALDILNLKPGVPFEEARQAYRNLAKKYHPDVAGEDITVQKNAEMRMKEINLAFRSLSAELKSTPRPAKPQSEKTPQNRSRSGRKEKTAPDFEQESKSDQRSEKKTDPFSWQQMMDDVLSFFKPAKKAKPTGASATVRKAPFQKNPGVRKNPPRFDEILKTVCPEGLPSIKKKKRGSRQSHNNPRTPYDGYQKYMALKKKIRAMQPRQNKDMSVGRVEKISPVKPVSRVKK